MFYVPFITCLGKCPQLPEWMPETQLTVSLTVPLNGSTYRGKRETYQGDYILVQSVSSSKIS